MVIISDVNLLRNLKYLDHERNQNSSVGCFFGMDATTAALIGICFLLCTSVLGWDDIKSEKAAWDKLVWFSSLVMMGSFLNSLGFTKWLGQLIGARIHEMSPTMDFIVLSALYGYCHYMFASGTAHTAAMFSVFLSVRIAVGIPPVPLTIVLGSLATLMGTLTHYGHGRAPIYLGSNFVTIGEWWKHGFVISVIMLVVWLGLGMVWWNMIGIW